MPFSYLLSLFLLFLTPTLAYDRASCFANAIGQLGNGTISPNSPFFYRDTNTTPPYNGPDNLTVTYPGCVYFCGPQQTWYKDIGPRLTIWLIPVLLLLANVELSPLDKRRFFAIIHLLGDPIDSIWSLLHKLDAWDRCVVLAEKYYESACPSCQRVVATVFAGYEEVQGPRIKSEGDYEALLEKHNVSTRFCEWQRAAVRLADGRNDELGRTGLAFLLYLLQIIATFVPAVGGAPSSPPGGRIATSELLSWLVPVIFLSNTIGSLPSCRTAFDIMADFGMKSPENMMYQQSVFLHTVPSLRRTCSASCTEALAWSGAIYTYRPWKMRPVPSRPRHNLRLLLLCSLAVMPILFGFIGGFLILWFQLTTGLNCRHVWLIGVTLLWSISAWITKITYSRCFATGMYHWRFTLIKDAFIATVSLLIMFLSGCGLFNFCWCWSGPFKYWGMGRVPLLETVYLENAKSIYPLIVGVTLVLELAVFAIAAMVWRRGFRLLRWGEKTCRREWERVMNGEGCRCTLGARSPQSSQGSDTVLLKQDEAGLSRF